MLHLSWKPACLHSGGTVLRTCLLPTSTARAKHVGQLPLLERCLDRSVCLDLSPAVPAAGLP